MAQHSGFLREDEADRHDLGGVQLLVVYGSNRSYRLEPPCDLRLPSDVDGLYRHRDSEETIAHKPWTPFSKPIPARLHAILPHSAHELGQASEEGPHKCSVFEDKLTAMMAGRRAEIQVVGLLHPALVREYDTAGARGVWRRGWRYLETGRRAHW